MKNIVHSLFTGAFQQRDLVIDVGQELNLGSNPNQFQTIKVISGLGFIYLNKEERIIEPDDLIQIQPGLHIQIKATGSIPLELFITGSGHI